MKTHILKVFIGRIVLVPCGVDNSVAAATDCDDDDDDDDGDDYNSGC